MAHNESEHIYHIRDPRGVKIGTFKDPKTAFWHFRGGLDAWLEEMVKGRHMELEEDGKTIAIGKIIVKIIKVNK